MPGAEWSREAPRTDPFLPDGVGGEVEAQEVKKRDAYIRRVTALWEDEPALEQMLLAQSALPGRRANLELAAAFADVMAQRRAGTEWMARVFKWAAMEPDRAPTNHPKEFLPFVALQALGAAYAECDEVVRREVVESLRRAARDVRWRAREACVFGHQRIGAWSVSSLQPLLETWCGSADALELRAILVTLADPPMLDANPEFAGYALSIGDDALATYSDRRKRDWTTEDQRVLRKGLEFVLSVFVAASPEEGFRTLGSWAESSDLEIRKIVASNLRKARLARRFPEKVEEVGERLAYGVGD